MRATFSSVNTHAKIQEAKDAGEAARLLNLGGELAPGPKPNLVFIDFSTTHPGGLDFLKALKASPETRRIPVLVFYSSSDEEALLRSYHLYANCFIQKPGDAGELARALKEIEQFWLGFVELP